MKELGKYFVHTADGEMFRGKSIEKVSDYWILYGIDKDDFLFDSYFPVNQVKRIDCLRSKDTKK